MMIAPPINRVLVALTIVAASLLFVGCDFVLSKSPVGEKPLEIDTPHWQGSWVVKDDVIKVRVTDGKTGTLQIT